MSNADARLRHAILEGRRPGVPGWPMRLPTLPGGPAAALSGLRRAELAVHLGGAATLAALLGTASVLGNPLPAFLDYCFADAADPAGGMSGDMPGGLWGWIGMHPLLTAALAGGGLMTLGLAIARPEPARLAQAARHITRAVRHRATAVTDPDVPAAPAAAPATAPDTDADAAPDTGLDLDRLYEAMVWAAEATGGIRAADLPGIFRAATGLEPPVWAQYVTQLNPRLPDEEDLEIFDDIACELERDIIMALVLKVGSARPSFSRPMRALVRMLSQRLDLPRARINDLIATVRAGDDPPALAA